MNRDDTRALLKARSALTSQPYGDEAIDAWHDALDQWTNHECRTALTKAARTHRTITVAHIVELLPPIINTPTTPLDQCELCDNTGWVDDDRYHSRSCARAGGCHCHGVKPCRCTKGQAMKETQRRIHEANNR